MNEENMKLEILKLIFVYSKAGRFPDHYFLDKVVEAVVRARDLDGYVHNIAFTDEIDDKNLAAYNFYKKQILMNYKQFHNDWQENDLFGLLTDSTELAFYHNIGITQVILHELEHALQWKIADDTQNTTIEAKLIRVAQSFSIMFNELEQSGEISHDLLEAYEAKYRQLYEKNYKVNPVERMAQINSYRTIINTIEPIKSQIFKAYLFHNILSWQAKTSGYESYLQEGLCPTQVYLTNMKREEIWRGFDFYDENLAVLLKKVSDEYSFDQRMLFGLPVSSGEYKMAKRTSVNGIARILVR